MTPEELQQFADWKVPPPTRDPHGEDSWAHPASARLKSANPRNWRLFGNELTADTDFGKYVHFIPTDLIMTGIDDDGLPILKKIGS